MTLSENEKFYCANGKWKWNWHKSGCVCNKGWLKNVIGRCTKPDCPVPTTQPDLNLDEFIRATWYAGKQQVQTYQLYKDQVF